MLPQETTKHKIIRYLLWSAMVFLPLMIGVLGYVKFNGHKADIVSNKPSNSTYVSQQQPATSFSQNPDVRVKFDMNSSEIAYLNFDVKGVNGKFVRSAKLSVYTLNDSDAPVDIYLVPKVADVTAMTWKTRSDLTGAKKIGSLLPGVGLVWRDAALAQPVWTDGPIELALVGTSNHEVRFASFGSANAPKLLFDTQDQIVEALPPVITISANPVTVVEGGSTTISWTSTNAPDSCSASGDWSGTKQPYGSEVIASLKDIKTHIFTLSCLNSSGGGSDSTSVAVTTQAAAPVEPGVKTTPSPPAPSPSPTPPPPTPSPSPTPPPPTPSPSPTPPPPTPPPSGGQTVGVPYTCTGAVNNLHIVGSGNASPALINLKSGCTGSLSFDITVDNGVDGVKVQQGAHDLNITSGSISCINGQAAGSHQDGVQVQGGTNVTFHNLTVNCPNSSGAGAFYIDGKDFGGINNVICDGCNLRHFVIPFIYTTGISPVVVSSGVRNSVLHMSPFQGNQCWTNPAGGSVGMINTNNSCVP